MNALELADWCDANSSGIYRPSALASAMLRSKHSEIERLKLSSQMITNKCADLMQERDTFCTEADVLRMSHNALVTMITKLHAAKGRYHTQLACCDLYDAVGLKNERPVK